MKNDQKFIQFYKGLHNRKNIFYTFFTSDLLFWVRKMMEFVPDEVNLCLLGAGLDDEEREWVRKQKRPAYFFDHYLDDTQVWELLFDVNENDFGWVDIDCFILNSELWREITVFSSPKQCINIIWSWESNFNILYGNTYFIFINKKVLDQVRAQIEISPRIYIYEGTRLENMPQPAYINEAQKQFLDGYVPEGVYPACRIICVLAFMIRCCFIRQFVRRRDIC